MKKPFYKKWWFITIVVLLLLSVIGNTLGEPTNNSATDDTVAQKAADTKEKDVEEKAASEQKAKEESTEKEAREAEEKTEQNAKDEAEKATKDKAQNSSEWLITIEGIAQNNDGVADKFYSLEKYMMGYEPSKDEVNTFKENILTLYKNGSYLATPTENVTMLTLIFQSYIVEQNSNKEWKDFAFDFHQNVKYVYRGVDAPNSDAVKANERQMDKVINKLK